MVLQNDYYIQLFSNDSFKKWFDLLKTILFEIIFSTNYSIVREIFIQKNHSIVEFHESPSFYQIFQHIRIILINFPLKIESLIIKFFNTEIFPHQSDTSLSRHFHKRPYKSKNLQLVQFIIRIRQLYTGLPMPQVNNHFRYTFNSYFRGTTSRPRYCGIIFRFVGFTMLLACHLWRKPSDTLCNSFTKLSAKWNPNVTHTAQLYNSRRKTKAKITSPKKRLFFRA